MTIDSPGCYSISAADYLRDVTPDPSLSAHIAHILLDQSPRHAWFAHARLNPDYQPEESEAFDVGKACHAFLLEGESGFVLIEAENFRTKEAREKRDAARAAGKIPLLASRWDDVQQMAHAARVQLARHEKPIPFTGGKPEQTLVWQEGGVWLRARLDWLHEDHRTVDDYKSCGASAHPAAWSRTLFNQGADLQAALYTRGVKRLFGVEPDFRFVCQETYAPYCLSVIGLDPEAMAFAQQKLDVALSTWAECVRSNTWPSYPLRTCYAEAPGWQQAAWMERSYYEQEAR